MPGNQGRVRISQCVFVSSDINFQGGVIRDHSTDSVGVRCDLELLTRMPSPLPMGDDCDSIDIVSLQTLVDCPTR